MLDFLINGLHKVEEMLCWTLQSESIFFLSFFACKPSNWKSKTLQMSTCLPAEFHWRAILCEIVIQRRSLWLAYHCCIMAWITINGVDKRICYDFDVWQIFDICSLYIGILVPILQFWGKWHSHMPGVMVYLDYKLIWPIIMPFG